MQEKCKKCRREGKKLFLKADRCLGANCSYTKRPYPPGPHGQSFHGKKLSEYGTQLREKQKTKLFYGLRENQFRKTFEKASKAEGNTGKVLLELLELRLDNVCHKAGFAGSRRASRQLILHGHILVNGKKVNIPSYLVREKDIVQIKDTKDFQFAKTEVPSWLKLDKKNFKIEVLKKPARDDISSDIKEDLIVELYSR